METNELYKQEKGKREVQISAAVFVDVPVSSCLRSLYLDMASTSRENGDHPCCIYYCRSYCNVIFEKYNTNSKCVGPKVTRFTFNRGQRKGNLWVS